MTTDRWHRLRLAALRLREIQIEAAAIYRRFPELDRRPKSGRLARPQTPRGMPPDATVWTAKLH